MSQQPEQIYEFGPYRLDVAERLLQREGVAVPLQPKVFDLLQALVERHGRLVEKDELMKAIWPDAVVEEANLANNISILRRTLSEYDQQLIETVPKRGYRFVAGIEVVEGKASENGASPKPVNDQPPPVADKTALTGRTLLLLLGVILTLGCLVFFLLRPDVQPKQPAINSLAVLPFRPLVSESHDEAWELGLADTVIFKLSGLKQLVVRPVSAVRKYTNPEQDPVAAGRALKVDFVLDPSFQRDGDRIRVRARLLNVADGKTLWVHECEEQYCANLFEMQDAISAKVVEALSLHLTGSEQARLIKHGTENREAYQLYLRGQYHLDKRTPQEAEKSLDYFHQALRLDHNYALAYVGVANAYVSLAWLSAAPPKEVLPKAEDAVVQALKIDDQLAEAHSVFAVVRERYYWDRQDAESEHLRALKLDPHSTIVRRLYAIYLMDAMRFEEAIDVIEQALELDPLSVIVNRDKAFHLYHAGRYDETLKQCQETLNLDPNFVTVYSWLERAYEAKGLYDQAIAADLKYLTLVGISPEKIAAQNEAYKVSGWKGYWHKQIEFLKEQAQRSRYTDPYRFVPLYARLGEKDQAFTWLEKAYENRSFNLNALKIDPLLVGLRSDPRFTDLLRRVGLER